LLFHLFLPSDVYTLSLHDALPIYPNTLFRQHLRKRASEREDCALSLKVFCYFSLFLRVLRRVIGMPIDTIPRPTWFDRFVANLRDRKSTRLNSSHVSISYAVFCLK